MQKYIIIISLLLTASVFMLIGGCDSYSKKKGLVATVNGTPIYLSTLQTLQDMQTYGLGAKQRISVEVLKKEYGLTISTLITNMLVMQELKKIGMEISSEDLKNAVHKISSAYPDKKFDNIFTDEHINFDIWKDLLLQQLSVEKFQNEVIYPQIIVPQAEILSYYEKNKQYFHLPERFTLTQQISSSKKDLKESRSNAKKAASEKNENIKMFTFTIRKKSVPEQWEKYIMALKLGESTPILFKDGYYQFFTLLEIIPAKKLTLPEILPIIHNKLSSEKIEHNFKIWLEDTIKKSKIQISKHLLANIKTREIKKESKQLLK